MKLTLDHTQRLNLHALLGAQRVDVGRIRSIWSIQDRIVLETEEEKKIELKREFVAGQERTVWNPTVLLQPKEFEFSDAELVQIRTALGAWANYGATVDRPWLEPLLRVVATPDSNSALA